MKTKANIALAAAIVTTLVVPGIASAQQAIFYPPSYSWNQTGATNIPGDVQASVRGEHTPRGPHAVRPYGQW
jgi:hypothetical protein